MTNMWKLVFSVFVFLSFSFSLGFAQSKPEMVFVSGGTYQMGNPNAEGEYKGDKDEKPVHSVTVNDFYIGKYEVTVREYREFVNAKGLKMPAPPSAEWMDEHPDTKKFYPLPTNTWWGWGDNLPIHNVTWREAADFCNWVSEKEGLQKCYSIKVLATTTKINGKDVTIYDTLVVADLKQNGYRLPTEAEWEFAARGGNMSRNTIFAGSNNPLDVAWFDENTELKSPKEVGKLKPNELGIYDMCGNVWEWCSDYYAANYYEYSPKDNPVNSNATPYRVIRGGAWHYQGSYATLTSRDGPEPGYTNYNYGFRLARSK